MVNECLRLLCLEHVVKIFYGFLVGFVQSFLSFLTPYDTAGVNWGLFGIESDFNCFVRVY